MFDHGGNNSVSEGSHALHPRGKPINQATHGGFSFPPTSAFKLRLFREY
jgi:hypothetical protein